MQQSKEARQGQVLDRLYMLKRLGLIYDTMIWARITQSLRSIQDTKMLSNICLYSSKGKPITFNKMTIPTKHAGTVHKKHRAVSDGHKITGKDLLYNKKRKIKE